MKHSPYSLHLERLATEAGLLVLHTEDRMYLSSKRPKLLGTVLLDPRDGNHYLSPVLGVPDRMYQKLQRLSIGARYHAIISKNHTPT